MKRKLLITLLMVITLVSVIWTLMLTIAKLRGNDSSSVSLMHLREDEGFSATKPITSMMIRDLNPKERHLSQDDTLSVEYSLINTGEDTLFILNVSPDCICTDYSLSSEVAVPGDSVCLEVVVDLKNKVGRNLVHIVIESNIEKRMEMIKVPFFVDYPEDRGFDGIMTKRLFSLKKMKVGEKTRVKSFIVNNTPQSAYVEVLTSCDCIEVEPRRMFVKSNERLDYSILVEPRIEGEYSEYILLRIDGGKDLIRVDVGGNAFND